MALAMALGSFSTVHGGEKRRGSVGFRRSQVDRADGLPVRRGLLIVFAQDCAGSRICEMSSFCAECRQPFRRCGCPQTHVRRTRLERDIRWSGSAMAKPWLKFILASRIAVAGGGKACRDVSRCNPVRSWRNGSSGLRISRGDCPMGFKCQHGQGNSERIGRG